MLSIGLLQNLPHLAAGEVSLSLLKFYLKTLDVVKYKICTILEFGINKIHSNSTSNRGIHHEKAS